MIPESNESAWEREEREAEEERREARRIREARFGEFLPPEPTPEPDPLLAAHLEALDEDLDRYLLARRIEYHAELGRGVYCAHEGRMDEHESPDEHARVCDCDQGAGLVALYPMTEDHRRWEVRAVREIATWTRAGRA